MGDEAGGAAGFFFSSRSRDARFHGDSSSDVYFFFQAEDGIRDLTVTGVQTCALPISVDCNCPPIRSCSARACRAGSRPRTETRPDVGARSPSRVSTRVVFPAPFGPRDRKSVV